MEKKYISVLVENHEGVLARLSSLFCQRGFNIDSLTVSATNDPTLSRITITTMGNSDEITQIMRQTEKLYEFKGFFELEPKQALLRELLLVKVRADESNRAALREIAAIYKAKIIDLSISSMVFELTGEPEKLDGFLEILSTYDIMEVCRTGVTALQRGDVKLLK
ncbi:MAG: acetolactate synthase small subunit [Acutalibacteraceae bacterium]|nr:acetolactate synthase small subunit [Acutalibacteraceae bacterium]